MTVVCVDSQGVQPATKLPAAEEQPRTRAPARSAPGKCVPANPSAVYKESIVEALLAAKADSGKTFTQIAKECGMTNLYIAQLFHNQVLATAPSSSSADLHAGPFPVP